MSGVAINLLDGEELRPVPGYEGLYSATNFGRVFSNPKVRGVLGAGKTRAGRWMTPAHDSYGYEVVSLTKNAKKAVVKVARIVASSFIPNPLGLPVVNHIDANRTNNNVSNLEWATVAQNNAHTKALGRRPTGRNVKNSRKMNDDQVREIRRRVAAGKETQRQIAADYGIGQPGISAIVTRKFYWYVE